MALRFQNLFCSESEDFDDEDFLSVLEGTECSSSTNHTAPVRLRPIFTKDTQVSGNVSSLAKPSHAQQTDAAQVDADIQSLDQDVDDEELLSVCSEMEAVGSQEQPLTPGPRPCLRPINQTSQDSSISNYASAFHLRPPGRSHCPDQEPSMLQRSFTECGQPKSQSCGFQMDSPTTPNNYLSGRGGGPYQSSDSSAKRLCLRPILETQPVPSARAGPCLAPSTYSGCTTPGGASGPGQCTSVNSAQPLPRTPQTSSWSHQPSNLQTPIVTNHLVQLVTAANKTPQKLAWETPPPKERRFPGPAGLLPQQGSVRRLDEVLVSPHHTPSHGARAKLRCKENVPSQQPQGDKFVEGPWATMKAELSLDENDPACFLRSYSVVMVLRKAALKQLPKNKVPRMAVALKSLTPANGDASAVFQDLTGEIQGTVHHVLLEEREAELKVGSVLLLQQVGVFSPSHRNHYLNVTPSNLVKIYPPGEDVGNARVPAPLMAQDEVSVNSDQSLPCSRSSEQVADSLSSSRIQPDVNHPSTSHTLGGAHQPSSSITLHKTPHSVLPHSFSSTVQNKGSAPLSSTAQARGPDPAGYHPSSSKIQTPALLSSTAQDRGPDPAGYHPSSSTIQTIAPLSSTAQARGPSPAGYHRSSSTIQTTAPLSSTAQDRGPDPAGYHPSSTTIQTTATLSSTAQARGPDPTGYHRSSSTIQTTAPLSSTAQARGPDPAGYHRSSSTIQTTASLSSTAQARGPDPAGYHRSSSTIQTTAPLSSTAQARGPDPAGYHRSSSTIQTTAPLSSTAQARGPDPAGYHRSSSTIQTTASLSSTAQARGPDPAGYHRSSSTIQTKALALQSSSSVPLPRTTQTADSGDWDMDDLDSLLCDLAEDPGD